jgi:hypothetical protein
MMSNNQCNNESTSLHQMYECISLRAHLPDAKQVDYLVGDTDDEKVESNINISNAFSKNLLPKLCETRWSARVDTLSVILAKYHQLNSQLAFHRASVVSELQFSLDCHQETM